MIFQAATKSHEKDRTEESSRAFAASFFLNMFVELTPKVKHVSLTVLFSKNRCVAFFHFCSQYVYPKV